jgi:hypothetical protein
MSIVTKNLFYNTVPDDTPFRIYQRFYLIIFTPIILPTTLLYRVQSCQIIKFAFQSNPTNATVYTENQ